MTSREKFAQEIRANGDEHRAFMCTFGAKTATTIPPDHDSLAQEIRANRDEHRAFTCTLAISKAVDTLVDQDPLDIIKRNSGIVTMYPEILTAIYGKVLQLRLDRRMIASTREGLMHQGFSEDETEYILSSPLSSSISSHR